MGVSAACGGRRVLESMLLVVLVLAGIGLLVAAPSPTLAGTFAGGRILCPGELFPVSQPLPAEGIAFYIHRPKDFPEGWFATLEGYPVRVLSGGEWVFGFPTPQGWRSTGCMVGTLDPTAVGMVAVTSPVSCPWGLPGPPPRRLAEGGMLRPVAVTMPAWVQNARFREVASWRSTVDRVGVLVKLPVVLAWKGETPGVVHAWTGKDWLSLTPRPGEDLDHLLARHLYTFTQLLHQSAVLWTGEDTAVLAAQCTSWGYRWSGVLALEIF